MLRQVRYRAMLEQLGNVEDVIAVYYVRILLKRARNKTDLKVPQLRPRQPTLAA